MPYKDVDAQREYQRKWRNARRALFVAEFGGVCEKCGGTDDLQFDHRDPEKKLDHRIFSWAIARIREELKKCQLLCEVCHIEKTNAQMQYPPRQHGTNLMYTRGACRCQPCRTAHAQVNAAYR